MIKKIEFELGYTPSNLRKIVEELRANDMTQQQIAESIFLNCLHGSELCVVERQIFDTFLNCLLRQ